MAKEEIQETSVWSLMSFRKRRVYAATELRTYLRSKLPEYMIPVTYVMLDKLPLSPNGKIDHKLLSQATGSSLRDNQFTAPQTAVEKQLAEIWAQLLRVGAVSVGDNFFDLGGHSLLATQLVSRIREAISDRAAAARLSLSCQRWQSWLNFWKPISGQRQGHMCRILTMSPAANTERYDDCRIFESPSKKKYSALGRERDAPTTMLRWVR